MHCRGVRSSTLIRMKWKSDLVVFLRNPYESRAFLLPVSALAKQGWSTACRVGVLCKNVRNTLSGHTWSRECVPCLSPFSLSVVYGRKVHLFTCKGVGAHRRYQQTDEAERFVPRLRPHGSSRPKYLSLRQYSKEWNIITVLCYND